MKNYLEQANYSIERAEELLLPDLKTDFIDAKIASSKFGTGVIKEISGFLYSLYTFKHSFAVLVSFNNNVEKKLDLIFSVDSGIISFCDETVAKKFADYKDVFNNISSIYKQDTINKQKAADEERERKKQEKLQKEKEEKALLKAEQNKRSQIRSANNLSSSVKHLAGNEYYYSIGWLAKHATNFTAAMPDYLDSWFVKEFGNVPHRSVDQSVHSPSGLPSQYALYFKIDLDTNENIPAYLMSHLGDVSKAKKPISDTQFIFNIMKNEGFIFGKAKDQNIDNIMRAVPSEFMSDFNAGYIS